MADLAYYKEDIDKSTYLYAGHDTDTVNNLVHYGWRFYDPQIGRWNAVDPLADLYTGFSPYNFVMNNPLRYTDAWGAYVNSQGNAFADQYYSEEGIYLGNDNAPSDTIRIVPNLNYLEYEGGKVKRTQDLLSHTRLLSSYNFNNYAYAMMLARITAHIALSMGERGTFGVKNSPAYASNAPMFTEGENIYVGRQNGKINPKLNDANNFRSALAHEFYHKRLGEGYPDRNPDNLEHTKAYIYQFWHYAFLRTTQDFRDGMAGAYADHLEKAYNDPNAPAQLNQINQRIGAFNELAPLFGYSLTYELSGDYKTVKIRRVKR